MATLEPDEGSVPWGKYSYNLEGLATGCYMEGIDTQNRPSVSRSQGQRIRFRVELPARCFVLSVAIKLPNAPPATLTALDDILIERTLSNGEFEVVYNPVLIDPNDPSSAIISSQPSKSLSNDPSNDSPTSVDQTSASQDNLIRKRIMDVRRAADSLRLTITDVEDDSNDSLSRQVVSGSEDTTESNDFRTLGIVVVGYIRGQTPASNRLKILLNSSARLPVDSAKADRAEVDGLLGLAYLASKRYRQAAELLQRASELVTDVASEDAKAGLATDAATKWAAELNLLSAHSYFEHMPICNDGIVRLILVATAYSSLSQSQTHDYINPRKVSDLTSDFLDLRTELFSMLQPLITILSDFLVDSSSPAVRMAAARTIEFISEQIGCGMAPHMTIILNHVLRAYPSLVAFGARERAAASSFSYDSMEDCFERLIDICCRLLPLTEHSVIYRLYDTTLIPVFLDAFHEVSYLQSDPDADEPEELQTTAVAQTLRLICLVLNLIGADARVPPSLVTRILNILVLDSGCPRTPLLLRRAALHAWDATSRSLAHAAVGNTVKAFEEYLKALNSYFPKLLIETVRVGFEYRELEEDSGADIQLFKEDYIFPDKYKDVLNSLSRKRTFRLEIADRHTLRRLVTLTTAICKSLGAQRQSDDDLGHSEAVFSLRHRLSHVIADLAMSNLIDVAFYEAVSCGIGTAENNSPFEFGHIDNQLLVVSEVLEELFESYWACVSLLPPRLAEEAVRTSPVRLFMGWCVDRMKYSSPPRGMLQLMQVCVRGLMNDINVCMGGESKDPSNPSEVTFLSIYRAHLFWLPQAVHEEAFDLLDILSESVAGDLMASDLLLIVEALGDQRDDSQVRNEKSLDAIAKIIAAGTPKDPERAVKSLKVLPESKTGNKRLSHGFPKSNSGSFNKKFNLFSNQTRLEPMVKAFYLHVVLSSCFDRFDSLAIASQRKAGPSYMGEKIDSFVEHAALAVRCLHACARSQAHREYVGAILGDIFGTCLAMEDHADVRVRLAGFEIFAASLDVLFLAQKSSLLGAQQGNLVSGVASALNSATPGVSYPQENGTLELGMHGDDNTSVSQSGSLIRSVNGNEQLKTQSNSSGIPISKENSINENANGEQKESDGDVGDKEIHEILSDGGSYSFRAEETPSAELAFEQRAWQMLCAFISSSLGVGKYVDFVVQRACLEYLRCCLINALRGRSSGASVISFEHIEVIWEAVSRLVGSPWRALNSLAMWIVCTVVNVAVYATMTARVRGPGKQRSAQLNDFVTNHVLRRAESLLKNTSQENRVWGMRLVEVYIRARDLNGALAQVIPVLPSRILKCLKSLESDWHGDVRKGSQALLDLHYNSVRRKSTNLPLTVQAQNFMYMKRNLIEDPDNADPSRVELWFPPIPSQLSDEDIKLYQYSLDAFASTEVIGGEEVDLVKHPEEMLVDDDEEEGGFDEDENYDIEGVDASPTSPDPSTGQLNGSADVEPNEVDKSEVTPSVEYEEDTEHGVKTEPEQEEPDNFSSPQEITDASSGELNGQSSATAGESPPPSGSFSESDVRPEVKNVDSSIHREDRPVDESNSSLGIQKEKGSNTDDDDVEVDVDVDIDIGAGEDNDDEDNEFADISTTSNIKEQPSELVTQVSDGEDDFKGFVDDVVDEDDVVDVTDEDDVLMDPGSVYSKNVTNNNASNDSADGDGQFSSVSKIMTGDDMKLKQSSAWPHSRIGAEMNPDLDEGKTVLRRKGSFTSRPTTAITLEEGDVPKLARRRSVDVSSIATSGNSEDTEALPSRNSVRLPRKKSTRHINSSPKTSEVMRSKSLEVTSVGRDNFRAGDSSESVLPKFQKRKSMKSMIQMFEEKNQQQNLDSEDLSEQGNESEIGVESSLINKNRTSSFPKTEDSDPVTNGNHESRPPLAPSTATRDSNGVKDHDQAPALPRTGSNRAARRSLPRAPAFLVGGGLQRRNSGPLIGTRSSDRTGSSVPSTSGNGLFANNPSVLSSGESNNSTTTGRPRLPRGKSQHNRIGRAATVGDLRPDRKGDRSHRFGRREPLKLGFQDEFDEDLFNDVNLIEDEHDGPDKPKPPSPTADALREQNALMDERPVGEIGTYKRHGSRRNIFESVQYRGLLDESGTRISDESGPSWRFSSSPGFRQKYDITEGTDK